MEILIKNIIINWDVSCRLFSIDRITKSPDHFFQLLQENFMLLEILTPLMLATSPATVLPNEDVRYSHEQQMTIGNDELAYGNVSTFTSNGTQTFDFQGRPWDADSDRD